MSCTIPTTSLINADMMLPAVLRQYPQVRAVLDRYGLRGCGGPHGPAESIGYFARAHGVDEAQLLSELNAAAVDPRAVPAPVESQSDALDRLADTIYRRFFKAGVVVVLTAGAVWGALLLLRIGFRGDFTAISIHEVNAHGHAQIFGWVGLFVMGFAYQAFPRMKHTSLWRPDLATMTFYLMVTAIFARAIGEPLFHWPLFRELAIAAAMVDTAAIALFIFILLKTFQLSGKPYERHDAYILASLAFFIIQAVYDIGLLYGTTTAGSREQLLHVVATYQAPLRDLQIHGFAMLMILGVGIRMFPALFGFSAPGPRLVKVGLGMLVLGTIIEAVGFIVMRRTGLHEYAGLMYAGMVLLAAASIALTFRWGLLARPSVQERSTKFIRAASTWLHISMIMLLLVPLYNRTILPGAAVLSESGRHSLEIGFSHAYYGAVRHAITVGFISLTILGMAAKVVPTLNGVDIRGLRPLWLPFALVNVGCFMRVAFQVLTDFQDWAFPVAGVSGLLEVAGIAVWGTHLWRIMNGWCPQEQTEIATITRISGDDKVGLVIEQFPATLPVLLAKGFAPLANPVFRRTMARAVSVRTAAAHHQLDLEALLAELNEAAFGGDRPAGVAAPQGRPLPVLNNRTGSAPVQHAGAV